LGGFFPPLVLGVVRDATGTYTLGFVFLAIFAAACLIERGARVAEVV
jgi:MFS transporter, NNP family, nitrate/nitrite transporter